jgi:hypothetical protein
MGRRGRQLIIYQLLTGPLQKTYIEKQADPEGPSPQEKSGLKHLKWKLPKVV